MSENEKLTHKDSCFHRSGKKILSYFQRFGEYLVSSVFLSFKRYVMLASRFGEYLVSSVWTAVPILAFFGILISSYFKLTMNKDVWFWFFSSIAQTFAALVALVAIFLISRLELYDAKINNYIQMIRNLIPEFSNDLKPDYLTVDELVLYHADDIERRFKSKNSNNVLSVENFPKNQTRQILYIVKARADIDKLKQTKEHAKNKMHALLAHTILIIMLSIFLIPFGSPNTEDSSMLVYWNNYNLKWVIIFGVTGLCMTTLYKVASLLDKFLSGEE